MSKSTIPNPLRMPRAKSGKFDRENLVLDTSVSPLRTQLHYEFAEHDVVHSDQPCEELGSVQKGPMIPRILRPESLSDYWHKLS